MSEFKPDIINKSIEIPMKFLPSSNLSEDLNKFKEEILSLISENNKKIDEKIENYKSEISKQENEYDAITKRINSQYSEILSSQAQINTKFDELKGYNAFVARTTDQITTHEIRISTLKMDLNKAIEKYDKIYLDNFVIPGVIGNYCKYKNCKDFIEDTLNQFSKLNSFKERNILDLKSYKEKLEGIIKTFQIMIDNSIKTNMQYSNEIGAKTERNCKDMIEIVNEKMMELRIENTKYAIELKEKSLDLSKDWEKILKIKEEINELFKKEVENYKIISNNNINSFNEFKKDFGFIRTKFFELAEFIKDVRFRKNLGNNVQKKEIKNVVKKITRKRKNSFDERDLKLTKDEKDILSFNFKRNDSTNQLRQSQSLDVENKKKKNIKDDRINNIKRIVSENSSINNKEDSFIDNSSNLTITINNNNNNRYNNNDNNLENNKNIIKELASELEQSNNRFDLIKQNLEKGNNNNLLEIKEKNFLNNSNKVILHSESASQLEQTTNLFEKYLIKEKFLNEISIQNNNITDLKNENKIMNNKLIELGNKINEIESNIKPKINEILNQIEIISNSNNKNSLNQNSVNNNYNFIHGNITNYGYNTNNNNTQPQNIKINNNIKVPPIDKSKISMINQKNTKKLTPSSTSPIKKNNYGNRGKTGRSPSHVENLIHQTLDNFNNENNNNNNPNQENKKLNKIEQKRENIGIKYMNKTNYNFNNFNTEINNNIQPSRWIQLNKINTNKGFKGQGHSKLNELNIKDD